MEDNDLNEDENIVDIKKYSNEQKKIVFSKEVKMKIYTLYQICKIIDLAVRRGAFKGSEVSFVGTFYDIIHRCISEAFSKLDEDIDV